jgi:hypothetical protein
MAYVRILATLLFVALWISGCGGDRSKRPYDGAATKAAAEADATARVDKPRRYALKIPDPEVAFSFKLTHNAGQVLVFRSLSDAEEALQAAEAMGTGPRVDDGDQTLVFRNVIAAFEKVPTAEEKRQIKGWLQTE